MNIKSIMFLSIFFVVFTVCGCGSDNSPVMTGTIAPLPDAGMTAIIGYSVQNRPVQRTTLGSGPETVLYMATIHGNEPVGTSLILRLKDELIANPELMKGKRVVIVPIANPDGFAANTRYNSNGIDLNRNFPADNRVNNSRNGDTGLTEPESKLLYDLINEINPARIIALHEPLACIDYDGPASILASRMADRCDLPLKKLGSRPGSLGSYAGLTRKIPIVTVEFRKSDRMLSTDQLWQAYGKMLMTPIIWPN